MMLCSTCGSYEVSLNNTNCTTSTNDVTVILSITLHHNDSELTLCPLLQDNSPYNITLFEYDITGMTVQFDNDPMCSPSSTLPYSISHNLLIVGGVSFAGACLVITVCSIILLMMRYKIKSLHKTANMKRWYSSWFIVA